MKEKMGGQARVSLAQTRERGPPSFSFVCCPWGGKGVIKLSYELNWCSDITLFISCIQNIFLNNSNIQCKSLKFKLSSVYNSNERINISASGKLTKQFDHSRTLYLGFSIYTSSSDKVYMFFRVDFLCIVLGQT